MDNNIQDIHIININNNKEKLVIRNVFVVRITFKNSLIEIEYATTKEYKTLVVEKRCNKLVID